MFEDHFRSLIFTIVSSEFATSVVQKLLCTATEEVLSTYPVDGHVQFGKPLLVALHPSVVYLSNFIGIKKMACGHPYNLAAAFMTLETMQAVNWLAISTVLASQWFPYGFVRRETYLFRTARNICITVHGVQHLVALVVITAIAWRHTPPFWESALLQATDSPCKPCPSLTSPSSSIKIIKSAVTFTIASSFKPTPTCVLSALSIEGLRTKMPSSYFPSSSVSRFTDYCDGYLAVGYCLLKFIEYHNISAIGTGCLFFCFCVFSCPFFFYYASFSAPVPSSPTSSSSSATTLSSTQPSLAPEPGVPSAPPREPVINLLRERLARGNVESAERYEAFLVCENHPLELEFFLAKLT